MREVAGVGLTLSDNRLHDQNVSSHDCDRRFQLDIYPPCSYYFGSKDAIPLKDETLADRVRRMKSNYAARGLRICVEAVIVVELYKHPHLLLLQVRNSIFKLPGGRLRPGESDVEGLKRKLARKLSDGEEGDGTEWEVLNPSWMNALECGGGLTETLQFPYLPPNVKRPKVVNSDNFLLLLMENALVSYPCFIVHEGTKLFLVKLPESRKFIVPKNLRLLAVPLCQIHENHKTYGPIISGVPQLLSKFSFNMIES